LGDAFPENRLNVTPSGAFSGVWLASGRGMAVCIHLGSSAENVCLLAASGCASAALLTGSAILKKVGVFMFNSSDSFL